MRGYYLLVMIVVCFFGYTTYEIFGAMNRITTRINDQMSLIQQGK